MKKLITLLALVITTITFAQAPQGFNYQATVRNSAGVLIVNQNVYFKFNLMLNSASSVPVFSETHYTPTDDLGQVNIVIGQGTATVGTFSTINWGTGNYYLGIELNTGGGYIAMGTTQLLSVPYALYANSSGNAPTSIPNLAAVLAVNNGANNLKISNLADPTVAQDAATKNYVDNAASANTTLPDGTIFVGNATNQATSVALSGDVTLTNTGAATIANNAITTAKIANTNVTNGKLDKANIPLSGFGAATADVNLGTKKLTNVADPTTAQEAATKNYVDSRIAAIQTSSQGKTSIYLTGNITNAQAVTKIAAELGPYTENIYIRNTTQLTTVDLSALVTISNIEIENNSNLATINLTNLSTIEDGFNCRGNAALNTLSFPALLNCSAFYITNNGLASLNLPLLRYINRFAINNWTDVNCTIVNLNFPAVQTIGGTFELYGLSSLTSITFPILNTLTGSIRIEPAYNTNNNITTLSFPALTSCTSFDYNTNLQIFQAAPGAIYINGNAANAAINLSSLASCNSISISGISSLNLSALSSCADIAINNNSSLTSLSFPSLTNNSNLNLNGNALTSNTVNSLLNKLLTVAPASGKNVYLDQQTPPAPPTGQGLVDKQTLIVAGNQVVTDGFLPTITTAAVTSITSSTATCGGTITNDGGGTIQGSGIVWATTTNPTTANGVLSNNTSNSTFISNLTGLNPGTTYYVRAYATTSSGTAYGNERSFTTLAALSIVSTTGITQIARNTAVSGGNITSSGGANVTAKGVCWSTSINPTVGLTTKTVDGTGNGIFTSNLTGLTAGTVYYVRAYATNAAGTAYGNESSFTTLAAILPTLTTSAITSITGASATSGGTITNDGGVAITARGIVWGTTTNPTIGSNLGITTDGTLTGNFTSNIINLSPGTRYYVRAYATNTVGTAYGDLLNFQALTIPATLQTLPITSVTETSATSGWNVTDLGGGQYLNPYLIWSLTPNPTLNTPNINQASYLGPLSHTIIMTNLLPNTTYYVRSVLITHNRENQSERYTGYGDVKVFTTLDTPTITNGTQVWSNTNLDVTTYRDGTPIPQVTDPTQWANLTTGAWCYYDNSSTDGATYGKLYNWYAVAGIHDNDPNTPNKVLAPTGWHVPSDAEWTTLITYLGGENIAGGKMKATGTTLWQTPNTAATNLSGFNGLPGGFRDESGSFNSKGFMGGWRSSTESDQTNAFERLISANSGVVTRCSLCSKIDGSSVRLVRD